MSPDGMAPATHAPPLWRQLRHAAELVRGVREGRSLSAQLEEVDAALRPGVQALSFHALRWLGRAQALRALLARRTPPPAVDALLCVGLALAQPELDALYEPFTLVDQTVEVANRQRALRPHVAFINACLRRFLRERDALLAAALQDPVGRWNHPRWWIERLRRDHPDHWQATLTAAQQASPMDLRVNLRRGSVQAFRDDLARAGLKSDALGGAAVRLHRPLPVQAIAGFAQGRVSVQSAAAQRAAPLLLAGWENVAPAVLDACAAPGGKTTHVLEVCPNARVTALDIDDTRSGRIRDNLRRLGLHADVRVADAADLPAWWGGEQYDAILLDAPCSGSGIVGRHPDARWLRRASDIAQLAGQQDRLIRALWPLLKPGGRMLYCTCSVFVEEGQDRIAAFLAHNKEAALLPSPGHLLPSEARTDASLGDNGGRDDGFYYALLQKHAG
ncbi:MAG: 16S rRNA (cytosine(967)-C(5))-methyltransferase RsmB [Pseudomonadota bacterium]|nr:16S rRNA (cytosine(967)-C(5))-methyltransferase RsmB [Pseudomonadota bacterium]